MKQFKPDGKPDTMEDLIKGYSLKAKDKGGYVGEFTWDAKQKDGPEYEVTLLWKEGNNHESALWRVDLSQKDVRPQGDAARVCRSARATAPSTVSGAGAPRRSARPARWSGPQMRRRKLTARCA